MIHIVTGKDMAAVEAFIETIKTPSSHVILKMVPYAHHTELPELVADVIKAHEHLIIHTFSEEIIHLIYFLAKPEGKPAEVDLSFDDIKLTQVIVRGEKPRIVELDGREFAIAVAGEMEFR